MPYQIVAIGEILWDVFPDGPRFGGAPANFCCSVAELAQQSANVSIVSAVGNDQLGHEAIEALKSHGVQTGAVQINESPTGRVDVTLDPSGVATYQFAVASAWDNIGENHQNRMIAERCDAICFGTLGQRNAQSEEAILNLVKSSPRSALRILDVNIRKPYINDEVIIRSLELANVLKLNEDELPAIGRLFEIQGTDIEVMRQLMQRFELLNVALTRGPEGAVILSKNVVSERPGTPVQVFDTVGAGDAFTAAMTLGLLQGNELDEINRHAMATAAYVCSQAGATMSFPSELRT